jgi:large subunit ribosomal protein L35
VDRIAGAKVLDGPDPLRYKGALFRKDGSIMGKQKTKKSVAKRFKRTARGKVLHARGGKSHLLGHKSRKRKRHLRQKLRASPSFEKALSLVLGK